MELIERAIMRILSEGPPVEFDRGGATPIDPRYEQPIEMEGEVTSGPGVIEYMDPGPPPSPARPSYAGWEGDYGYPEGPRSETYGGDPILDPPIADHPQTQSPYANRRHEQHLKRFFGPQLSFSSEERSPSSQRNLSAIVDQSKAWPEGPYAERNARSEEDPWGMVSEGYGRSVDPREIHDSGEWYGRRLNPEAYYSRDPRLQSDTAELESEMGIRDRERDRDREAIFKQLLGILYPGSGR